MGSGAGTLRPHHHSYANTLGNAAAVGHPDLYGDSDVFSNANSGGISYAYTDTISDPHSYAFNYADHNTFGDSDPFSNAHSGGIPYAYTDTISDAHSYAFDYADRNTFDDSDAFNNAHSGGISYAHSNALSDAHTVGLRSRQHSGF